MSPHSPIEFLVPGKLASPPFPPGIEVDLASACISATLGLTRTEAAIALAVAAGCSDSDIAASRGRSVATVKTCMRMVLKKVGVRSRCGVAAMVVGTVWAVMYSHPNGSIQTD